MTTSAWTEFRAGMIEMVPFVAAALPMGLLFGTLAAAKGLSPLEAGLMSATVFAGAAQFVAIDLWRDPAPWGLLTLTAFIVNLRHVLMGTSMARHMGQFRTRWRPFALFVMVDETWAFAERRALKGPLPPAYFWGMGAVMWTQWVIGSTVGAVVGQTLGDPATYGFDFAFTAMFICILSGFWRGPRTGAILAASGAAAAATHLAVPGAWYIMTGATAGVVMALATAEPESARVDDA
ncbi:MAG: AzlC family ABC transporter permease [Hyphomicrobiales bacterium]